MTATKLILMLVYLLSVPLETKEARVTPLFSKDLAEFPGKEGLMITVEYPPGSSDPIHRHNAHAFVYVLEGSIVMQLKGGRKGSDSDTWSDLLRRSL
jgi:quercetin dioxygenase-like cupin family protein